MIQQRKIIHIDMDSFYASIEERDQPQLRGKIVAVGGSPKERGVICSANYAARKYGVRSAMATAHALKLCPAVILVPVQMHKYREVSQQIRRIFLRYTDQVEPLSLDEAYLDVTQCEAFQGSATRIAKVIKAEIHSTQQLTASAGVAPNKLLAKIASDLNKPNGLYVITPNDVNSFMQTLSVDRLFGVGKVMANKLQNQGIKTCQDLQAWSLSNLMQHFGKMGVCLYEFCRGHDDRPVEPHRIRKSVSVEETFLTDLPDMQSCLNHLTALLPRLIKRLERCTDLVVHKQFVKLKFHDFTRTTVEHVTNGFTPEFFTELLQQGFTRQQKSIRLLGIGVRFSTKKFSTKQLDLLA